jgi:hypothetical protein
MQVCDIEAVPNHSERLPRSAKITGPARAELAQAWRQSYESGASIRRIAESSGRSYGFVRQVLVESGTTLRERGGSIEARRARPH